MATVDLTWTDNSSNEDGFYVYRTTTSNPSFPGDYTQIANLGANTTSYSDTNAPDGTTAYYAVTAYNSGGESSETTTSIQTTAAPTTPQNLSSSVTQDDISLNWDSVDWNGDQGHYNILRAQSSGGAYTEIDTVTAGTTSYTDSALEDGERFYYVVTAENSEGTSGQSNETASTTALPAPSSASLDTSVEDEITVSWTNNDDSSDGSIIVYRSQSSGTLGSSVLNTSTLSTTSYTDTGLEDGEEYYYTVRRSTPHANSDSSQVSGITVLPGPSSISGTSSEFDYSSVKNVDSGMITAPTTTGVQSYDVGFQPDVVVFIGTNTNEGSNSGSEVSETDDYGWMHGAADFQNSIERAIFSGSGSSSTKGQATETTTTEAINILELPDSGNGINNRIQASATQTSNGFDLDFTSVGQAEHIQYRAYSFDSTGGIEIGFFNARTTTGTQSVSTSITPDFVKFVGQPRATTNDETVQDGNDHGLSHGWLTSSTQVSMAFASYSNNVDDHVYGARNDSCLLVKHQGSKGGVTGTTEATGTLTSSGFDLDYSSVDGVGETILYMAIEVDESVEVKTVNSATSTGTTQIQGDWRELHVTGNSTIDSMNVDGYSGSNQDSVTYGWSHGGGHSTATQSVLSIGVSSNSVNAHRNYSATGESQRLLFTDASGNDDGSDDATWSAHTAGDSITLDYTSVVTSSTSGISDSHVDAPLVLWGFKTTKSGTQVELSWTNNDDSSDGGISIERSSDGGSTWTTLTTGLSPTTTSYTDTGASSGETYTYRVTRSTDHTSSSDTTSVSTGTTTNKITIDGSSPTEITIDGSTVTEITIDGDVVWKI